MTPAVIRRSATPPPTAPPMMAALEPELDPAPVAAPLGRPKSGDSSARKYETQEPALRSNSNAELSVVVVFLESVNPPQTTTTPVAETAHAILVLPEGAGGRGVQLRVWTSNSKSWFEAEVPAAVIPPNK